MEFNSTEFLLIFLPLTLLSFVAVAPRFRLAVLLFFSTLFYAQAGNIDLVLLVICSLCGYAVGRLLIRKPSIYMLLGGIFIPLFFLLLTKFTGKIIFSFAGPDAQELYLLIFEKVSIPLGISFYSFQIIAYLIDVYRNKIEPERGFVKYGAFILFFPQVIAGPILRYDKIGPQLEAIRNKRLDELNIDTFSAFKFLAFGLVYKVFFADVLDIFVGEINQEQAFDILFMILGKSAVIYFDFWGYSLMAIGIANLFAISIPRNFLEPYKSRSPREFWRRWHVTLSYWIKDYLYLNLGGNERYFRNILIVFLVCGIWHGAGLRFIAWGLYHAALVLFYHLTKPWWSRLPAYIQISLTFILVSLGWPLFFFSFGTYVDLLMGLVTLQWTTDGTTREFFHWGYLASVLFWIFCVSEDRVVFGKRWSRLRWLEPVTYGIMITCAISFMNFSKTFIYFRF